MGGKIQHGAGTPSVSTARYTFSDARRLRTVPLLHCESGSCVDPSSGWSYDAGCG
jgi:hypothetical protein